jgi:hypothetical protein
MCRDTGLERGLKKRKGHRHRIEKGTEKNRDTGLERELKRTETQD